MNEMTGPSKEITLPTILSSYNYDEVGNADEFGFLFCMQPDQSINLRPEASVEGRHIKIRVTGMLAANAMIDKLKMFSQENQNSLAGSVESNVPCI